MGRDGVFISYSKKDIKWLTRIKTPLRFLELHNQFNIWDDTQIKVSADWNKEIENSINRCKVAIFLISENFLATEFILKKEIPQFIKGAKLDGAKIFNIILDHNVFKKTPLSAFQSLNNPDEPLMYLSRVEQQKFMVKLVEEVQAALEEITPVIIAPNNFPNFCQLAVILSKVATAQEGRSISELEQAVTMSRKDVVTCINQLEETGLIEKSYLPGKEKRKPSTVWKATFHGREAHKNLVNQIVGIE
jgi:hypothetical protein